MKNVFLFAVFVSCLASVCCADPVVAFTDGTNIYYGEATNAVIFNVDGIVYTNETNLLNLSNTNNNICVNYDPNFGCSAINSDYLFDTLSQYQEETLYGRTNIHPDSAVWSMLSFDKPEENYTMSLATDRYTNSVGIYVTTNVFLGGSVLSSGKYNFNANGYASVADRVRTYCELVALSTNGVTTNLIVTSSLSSYWGASEAYQFMLEELNSVYTFPSGTNWYLGVNFYTIRNGAAATTIYLVFRTSANTSHMDTPNLSGAGFVSITGGTAISAPRSGSSYTINWDGPQTSTNDSPTSFVPRLLGDNLIIYTSTNKVYRAFGTTTNDWKQTYP